MAQCSDHNNINHDNKQEIIDLLVVGAGPTGLTAALEATRMGMSVRIIDHKPERGSPADSRALVVHPRVMELIKVHGDGAVTDEIKRQSFAIDNLNFTLGSSLKKRQVVPIPFHKADLGDTEFKPSSWLPQYKTERILEGQLERSGVKVEWSTGVSNVEQHEHYAVPSVTRDAAGTKETETFKARFVMGCDGGRSKTRELAGIEMHRTKTAYYLAVAEIDFVDACLPTTDIAVFINKHGTCAAFPLNEGNRFRAFILEPEQNSTTNITDDYVRSRFRTVSKVETPFKILHKCVFNISHGVADKYRNGRVFLAGDAAHVHSPLGGQGMNYGMQDSINLIWKMAWVKRMQKSRTEYSINQAMSTVLDSYQLERRSLGEELIKQTSKGSDVILSKNSLVQLFRNYMISHWAPHMMVNTDAARGLAQLKTQYDPSLSPILDNARTQHGRFIANAGERLPNLLLDDGSKLYDCLSRERHTLVVLNLDDEHPGGATKLLFPGEIVAANVNNKQESRPHLSEKQYLRPQLVVVRPDFTVCTVGKSSSKVQHRLTEILHSEAFGCI